MKKASIELNQFIVKNNKKVFDMNVLLVFIKDGKMAKISDEFLEVFNKL